MVGGVGGFREEFGNPQKTECHGSGWWGLFIRLSLGERVDGVHYLFFLISWFSLSFLYSTSFLQKSAIPFSPTTSS